MHQNKHIFHILSTVAILVVVSIGLSHTAHAQTTYQYTPLATIPLGTTGQTLTTAGQAVDPAAYVKNLYVFAFSAGVVIAVVSGVWAGVEWMLGGDSPSKIGDAKKRLESVAWGFALLLCSYVFLDIINPQLVTFSLNLGSINTANLSGQAQTALQIQQLLTTANAAVTQAQADQSQVTNLQQQIAANNQQLATMNRATPEARALVAQTLALSQQLSTAQSTASQSAEVATVAQTNAFVTSDLSKITNDITDKSKDAATGDLQKLQSDYNAALTALQQQQVAATAANNTALVNQITQDRATLNSSLQKQYGCVVSSLRVSTQTPTNSNAIETPVITCGN